VADLGQGSGAPGASAPLFWIKKKKKIAEGRKAGSASKTPPLPPLAKGLDPPLS